MTLEAIFFDVGNVLVEVCYEPLFAALEMDYGINPAIAAKLAEEGGLVRRYNLGRINSARFFTEARDMLGFPGSLSEMESLWCGIFRPLEANMAWVKLLAKRLPLALISNTNASHCAFLEARYDIFALFQHKIYSHLVGLVKPDPRIFELALQRMNVRADKALFIDDQADNVKAAEALGFNTLHLETPTSLPERLLGALKA